MENSQKVKTVMIGDHRFKLPFFDLIPFDHEQDNNLGEAIREAGAVLVPVVCWKEKKSSGEDTVVDGAHRIFWASKLGLTKVPIDRLSFADEDAAKEECERLNFQRRHSPEELLRANRIARLERIAARRQQGESTRAIAEAEKVSQTQVQADLAEAGEHPPCSPADSNERSSKSSTYQSGKITGKDGKDYPAKRPPILCERCKRVGTATPDCEGCKEARKAARIDSHGRKIKKPKKPKAPRGELKDQLGNILPDSCRDAFADPSLANLIEELEQAEAMIRPESWVTRAGKLTDHYGFILITKFDEHVVEALHRIQLGREALLAGVPYAVCPKCKGVDSKKDGKTCRGCRGYGHVPEWKYQEAIS